MTDRKTFLAVDLGASSGRVIAGVWNEQMIELNELHRFDNHPVRRDGSYRWDIHGLFAEIKAGLRIANEAYGSSIVSIGVDSWGVDYALIDAGGQLVDDPFAYRDGRTAGMMEEAFRRVPRREIYDVTGIQFMPINTLYQVLSERISARPQFQRADRLLFTPDLINFWLCGRSVNEYTIASTGQMLDAEARGYATDLLARLDLPADLFCEIVEPGEILGPLLPDVAAETGLQGVDIVAVGCHDTASAVVAVPAETESSVYLSSGTWSLMGIETTRPIINDKTYEYGFTNEGGVGWTIRLLKNITGLWLIQECRRIWCESGDDLDFEEISRRAADAEPFRAFIDPDHESFANPCDMPSRIREYCSRTGQTVPESTGAVARTVFDSLAFRCRTVFDLLEDVAGRRLEVLHVVGGGTQNRLLNRLTANAVNRRAVIGPVEATAAGNVLVQMHASGAISSLSEGREAIRRSFPLEILKPGDHDQTEQAYQRYREVTRA